MGRPIIKEQQDESAVHHALILDAFTKELPSEAFEAALAVAVSFLMEKQLEANLLDIIYAAQNTHCVTVGSTLRQREPMLETLATLSPCQTHTFDGLRPIVQSRLSRLSGCLCLLLDFDETRSSFLKMLNQHGIPIKVLVLGGQCIRQEEPLDDLLSPQCQVHFIEIDQIQQDLWLI